MRKSTKKTLATLTACAMLGAVAVGGTLAYLTDNETATNTITVGDVQADLIEPNWPGNGEEGTTLVVPTEEVTKDPQVANTGTSDAIVFLSVAVPNKAVDTISIDGTTLDATAKDVVYFKLANDAQTALANNWNTTADAITAATGEVEGNWIKVSETTANGTTTYVFGYNQTLEKDKKTEPLFEKIQLVNAVDEGDFTVNGEDIVITAYAIQADGAHTADADLTTAAGLGTIYDLIVNQNTATGATLKDAGGYNALTLTGQERVE